MKAEEWLASHQEIIKICVPGYKGMEEESEQSAEGADGADGAEGAEGAEGGSGKEKAGEGEGEGEGGAKEVVMGDAQAAEGAKEGDAKEGDAKDDGMDLECNEEAVDGAADAEEQEPAPPAGPPLPTKFVQLSQLETCIMAADKINAHIDELEQMKVRRGQSSGGGR